MPSPLPNDDPRKLSHVDSAARAASIGALVGAAKWGAVSLAGVALAHAFSPLVRNLTIQFRVYLWMCPTTIGSMVEADHRLRMYETMVRAERREKIEEARERALVEEMVLLDEMEARAKERAATKGK
ncbi:hypothetical protein BZA05DRAFT_248438 [Tricharina praecox]|uniref:uncharacterized protein n=1 Tax=Tricharina praecox TaxID=43433 RepID=UPI0022205B66|nr:uncharacterized protein BZA05DRAFT_248438 [Tricharina praecox]KAI5854730.1 hypothetical protein BZA05DRAFT_248438 [Tricharina praecox]